MTDFNFKINERLAEAAEKGKLIKDNGPLCGSCAFRLNHGANLEPRNVEAALEILTFGGSFHCHKWNKETQEFEDAGRVCNGYLHAKQYFDSIDKEEEDFRIHLPSGKVGKFIRSSKSPGQPEKIKIKLQNGKTFSAPADEFKNV